MGRAWLAAFLLAPTVWACAADPPAGNASQATETAASAPAADEPHPPEGRSQPPSSGSKHAALRRTELVIAGLGPSRDGVYLELVFANRGDGFALWPQPLGGSIEVQANDGRAHAVSRATPGFLDRLSTEGLPPHTERRGGVYFPVTRQGRLILRVPGFEPLSFDPSGLPQLVDVSSLAALAPDSPPTHEERTPRSRLALELRALLDRHAAALASTDFSAYLASFSPTAQDHERRVIQRARQIPFTDLRLELAEEHLPSTPGDRLEVQTEMTYRLEGQGEDNPFVHPLRFELRREEEEWKIAAVLEDSRRPIFWRQPDLALHRTHHFLIYVWPSANYDVLQVAREAEAAYATILQRGLPLDSRYVAHVVTDADLFRQVVGSPFAVGAAISRQVASNGGVRVDSRAFYLNGPMLHPHRLGQPSDEERLTTIAHELVHLALSRETRPHTPLWVSEGTAVFFSGGLDNDANRRLARGPLPRLSLAQLTGTSSLGEHDSDALGQRARDEYLYAANLVEYLVRHFGRDVFLSFYRSYSELPLLLERGQPLAGHLSNKLTADGLERHFELTPDTFEAAVKRSLRLRYR